MTFKEFTRTSEWQKGAESESGNSIFTTLVFCGYLAFFNADIQLGLHWIWVVCALCFGVSIFVAIPLYALHTYIIFKLKPLTLWPFVSTLRLFWVFFRSICNVIICITVTYIFVSYVAGPPESFNADVKNRAWIILEFQSATHGPIEISFDNSDVPDLTIKECKRILPEILPALIEEARLMMPVKDVDFIDAECVLSMGDPLKASKT